ALAAALDAWPFRPAAPTAPTAPEVPPLAGGDPSAGRDPGPGRAPAELLDGLALFVATVDEDMAYVDVLDLVDPDGGAPVRVAAEAIGAASVRPWGALASVSGVTWMVTAGGDGPTPVDATERVLAGPDGPWIVDEDATTGRSQVAPWSGGDPADAEPGGGAPGGVSGSAGARPIDVPPHAGLTSITERGALVRLEGMDEHYLLAASGELVLFARGDDVAAGQHGLVVRRCEPSACTVVSARPDGSSIPLDAEVARAVLDGALVVPSPDGASALVVEPRPAPAADDAAGDEAAGEDADGGDGGDDAATGDATTATVVDLRTGGVRASWPHRGFSSAELDTAAFATWDPSGRVVLMADDTGALVAHDARTGDLRRVAVAARPPGRVTAAVLAPAS
ncbi:MAG: hypothetical protein S0880_31735, partial [Actinomycetota bacterium]|nr:hypothetical protein [Actinomycetota bacterium]